MNEKIISILRIKNISLNENTSSMYDLMNIRIMNHKQPTFIGEGLHSSEPTATKY